MKQWALILGASSGFGGAIASAFADEGFGIIGVHLDRAAGMENVNKSIADIKAKGVQAHFFNVNEEDIEKRNFVLDHVENGGFFKKGEDNIKVLVHSLAFGTLKPYFGEKPEDDLTQKQLEMTIDVMGNSIVYWSHDIIRRELMGRGG